MQKKTIEDTYKKMDLHPHILKRPGTYIGSTKVENTALWIYNENCGEDDSEFKIVDTKYVPGLYKIFDEILVNARDHVIRCREDKVELCNRIAVTIDQKEGRITVWNNGQSIPVQIHKEHKIYVPELIFGNLLSSTNYDDDVKRKVGGLNGLGAKLTNVFSTEFVIEVCDSECGKKYYQKFTNNMYDKSEPKITKATGKKSYTQISFVPDFEKFGVKGLTKNVVAKNVFMILQ